MEFEHFDFNTNDRNPFNLTQTWLLHTKPTLQIKHIQTEGRM